MLDIFYFNFNDKSFNYLIFRDFIELFNFLSSCYKHILIYRIYDYERHDFVVNYHNIF